MEDSTIPALLPRRGPPAIDVKKSHPSRRLTSIHRRRSSDVAMFRDVGHCMVLAPQLLLHLVTLAGAWTAGPICRLQRTSERLPNNFLEKAMSSSSQNIESAKSSTQNYLIVIEEDEKLHCGHLEQCGTFVLRSKLESPATVTCTHGPEKSFDSPFAGDKKSFELAANKDRELTIRNDAQAGSYLLEIETTEDPRLTDTGLILVVEEKEGCAANSNGPLTNNGHLTNKLGFSFYPDERAGIVTSLTRFYSRGGTDLIVEITGRVDKGKKLSLSTYDDHDTQNVVFRDEQRITYKDVDHTNTLPADGKELGVLLTSLGPSQGGGTEYVEIIVDDP